VLFRSEGEGGSGECAIDDDAAAGEEEDGGGGGGGRERGRVDHVV
jgi:hypothetical protein